MKRFIKEYAAYKVKEISQNELIQSVFKVEKIAKIEKILRLANNGMLTVDETIREILSI